MWNGVGGRVALVTGGAGLVNAGRVTDATRLIEELIERLTKARRGKDTARWHTRLGTIAEARGDTAAAAASFGAAYKLDPSHPGTVAALGRLDVLVNNAGALGAQLNVPLLELDEATWHLMVDSHLTGTFLCLKHAAPHMVRQRWGRVVNTSSVTAGSEGAHASTRREGRRHRHPHRRAGAGPHGVTVNAVSPGYVDTERPAARSGRPDVIARQIPVGRIGRRRRSPRPWCSSPPTAPPGNGAVLDIHGGRMEYVEPAPTLTEESHPCGRQHRSRPKRSPVQRHVGYGATWLGPVLVAVRLPRHRHRRQVVHRLHRAGVDAGPRLTTPGDQAALARCGRSSRARGLPTRRDSTASAWLTSARRPNIARRPDRVLGIESAMKLAMINRPPHRFVTFYHAYHGNTLATMVSLGARPAAGHYGPGVKFSCSCRTCPRAEPVRVPLLAAGPEPTGARRGCAAPSTTRPARGGRPGGGDPDGAIRATGGGIVFPAAFVREVRRIADEFNAHLIFDEIQTGFGRTGRMFAGGLEVTPDIMVLSKAIGGGFPMRLVVADDRLKQFGDGRASTRSARTRRPGSGVGVIEIRARPHPRAPARWSALHARAEAPPGQCTADRRHRGRALPRCRLVGRRDAGAGRRGGQAPGRRGLEAWRDPGHRVGAAERDQDQAPARHRRGRGRDGARRSGRLPEGRLPVAPATVRSPGPAHSIRASAIITVWPKAARPARSVDGSAPGVKTV